MNVRNKIRFSLIEILDLAKKNLGLRDFSGTESEGHILNKTRLKFVRNTQIYAPFELGRTIRGVSFNNIHNDHFAIMVSHLVSGVSVQELTYSLYSEYKKEKLLKISDFLGFQNNSILKKYPLWSLVMPWEHESLQDRYDSYFGSFLRNRSGHELAVENINFNVNCEEIFYSTDTAKSQVQQTWGIWKSIKKNGYIETRNSPRINILVNSNQWRWVMSGSGNHRAYIASALKYKNLLAQIKQVIRRHDVEKWSNVKNGTYSPEEALTIFDSVFSGNAIVRGLV